MMTTACHDRKPMMIGSKPRAPNCKITPWRNWYTARSFARSKNRGSPITYATSKGQFGSEWIENAGSQSVPYAFTKHAYYKQVQGRAWLSTFEELKKKNENDFVLDRRSEYVCVEPEHLRQRY